MNKRELIKALFKNPTIKALYESGHFDAMDINRAILTEASDIEESTKNFPVEKRPSAGFSCRQGITRDFNAGKEKRNFDAFLSKYAEKIPYKNWEEVSNKDKETLTNYVKYIKETLIPQQIEIFQAEEAAKSTETTEDDEAAAAAQQKVDAAAETAMNNTDQKLQGSAGGEKNNTDEITQTILKNLPNNVYWVKKLQKENPTFGPSLDKIVYRFYLEMDEVLKMKTVKEKKRLSQELANKIPKEQQDQIWGKINELLGRKTDKPPEDTKTSDLDRLSSAFDQMFGDTLGFVKAPDMIDGKKPYGYEEKGKPLIEKIRKAAIMNAFGSEEEQFSGTIHLTVLKEARVLIKGIDPKQFDYITIKRVIPDEFKQALKDNFDSIKATYNENIGSVKTDEPAESSVDPAVIAELEKLLNNTDKRLLPLVNKYPKFKELLAVAYVKALKEKPEETATTPEPPTPETGTTTPSPQPATPASSPEENTTAAMGESINRTLSGIFLIENTNGEETNPTSTEGGTEDIENTTPTGQPVDADEVPKMLEALKQVFKKKNLAINVDEIWNLSQQKEKPEDKQDPNLEDVSPPELAELQENWTEVLMTFFGKNPKKSSFMRRLLLRSQAQMLYGVMDVLEQISDPEQMSAYTDIDQDDEREKKAEKPKQEPEATDNAGGENAQTNPPKLPESLREVFPGGPSRSGALKLDTSPEGIAKSKGEPTDEVEPEEVQPEPEQPQPEPEAQSDKVELPAKTRRIIKQDLQSMVDLLRQLKLAIKDYSMYATRKSADPRFDGSKLKANMDKLLVQVQDDIYDLHSNLKPADLAPETDDGSLEEALNGIMLEEDDPERQAKIQLVRETYDNAKKEYVYVLMPSMKEPNWSKSQASAKKILDILKEEKFISLFPTGMKTAGGKVMTVGKAYESMTAVIQEFVKTVRNIVLISKEKYISRSSLTEAKNSLENISIEIADLFRVPSKFSPEEIKQAKEEEATDPANKAITPEPEEKLEKKKEDNVPAPAAPDSDGSAASTGEEEGEATRPEDPVNTPEINNQNLEEYFSRMDDPKEKHILQPLLSFLEEMISNPDWRRSNPINESFIGKIRGGFRKATASREKIYKQIEEDLEKIGIPEKNISAFLSFLPDHMDSMLKAFPAKEIVDYIKQFFEKNLVKLIYNFSSIDSTFLKLAGNVSFEDGKMPRGKTEGQKFEDITDEDYEKINQLDVSGTYPQLYELSKALKGFFGTKYENYFKDYINTYIAMYPPDEYVDQKTTAHYYSNLFRRTGSLSNIRSKYGKDIYVYLGQVLVQLEQADRELEVAYKTVFNQDLEDKSEFEEKYKKAYELFKKHFGTGMPGLKSLENFTTAILTAKQYTIALSEIDQEFIGKLLNPDQDPILDLSNNQVYDISAEMKKDQPDLFENLEEALKPIIETMLKEHYNH